jgi:selenium metabolism protein YedF
VTLLYLNSDRIGQGDDELGRRLLRIFLEKLAVSEVRVDFVACLNGGVRLTTQGSDVLPSLEALAGRGARILSCGTCLEHFELKDRLALGTVGGMPQTVELFASADRVIAPC